VPDGVLSFVPSQRRELPPSVRSTGGVSRESGERSARSAETKGALSTRHYRATVPPAQTTGTNHAPHHPRHTGARRLHAGSPRASRHRPEARHPPRTAHTSPRPISRVPRLRAPKTKTQNPHRPHATARADACAQRQHHRPSRNAQVKPPPSRRAARQRRAELIPSPSKDRTTKPRGELPPSVAKRLGAVAAAQSAADGGGSRKSS
jgi:hypothetical protein